METRDDFWILLYFLIFYREKMFRSFLITYSWWVRHIWKILSIPGNAWMILRVSIILFAWGSVNWFPLSSLPDIFQASPVMLQVLEFVTIIQTKSRRWIIRNSTRIQPETTRLNICTQCECFIGFSMKSSHTYLILHTYNKKLWSLRTVPFYWNSKFWS